MTNEQSIYNAKINNIKNALELFRLTHTESRDKMDIWLEVLTKTENLEGKNDTDN